MPSLQLQLLDHFRLLYNDEPLTGVTQARLQSLLAYLALHRHMLLSRQHLAFLFWPDSSEAQAHTNLRQLLHLLRSAWPTVGEFLHIDAKSLSWQPEAFFRCDVIEFEQSLTR